MIDAENAMVRNIWRAVATAGAFVLLFVALIWTSDFLGYRLLHSWRGHLYLIMDVLVLTSFFCISAYMVAKRDWAIYPRWILFCLVLSPVVWLWMSNGGGKIPVRLVYPCGYCMVMAMLVFYVADFGERSRRLHAAAEDRLVRDRLERLKNFKLAPGKEKVGDAKQAPELSDD